MLDLLLSIQSGASSFLVEMQVFPPEKLRGLHLTTGHHHRHKRWLRAGYDSALVELMGTTGEAPVSPVPEILLCPLSSFSVRPQALPAAFHKGGGSAQTCHFQRANPAGGLNC